MPKETGGNAFPDPAPSEDGRQGMTLRDWFAGLAMQAIIRNTGISAFGDDNALQYAHRAYLTADAMLEERKKG